MITEYNLIYKTYEIGFKAKDIDKLRNILISTKDDVLIDIANNKLNTVIRSRKNGESIFIISLITDVDLSRYESWFILSGITYEYSLYCRVDDLFSWNMKYEHN